MYKQEFIFDGLTRDNADKLMAAVKTIPGIVSVTDDLVRESTLTIIYRKRLKESLLREAAKIANMYYRCPASKKKPY